MNTALHLARRPASIGGMARRLAGLALAVLALSAALLALAWAIGGEDAVSDNWVGMTVAVGFFSGLVGSFVALVAAVLAGLHHEPWSRMWLPLATFPAVAAVVVLLEALVLE
jgi:hypothetical protein